MHEVTITRLPARPLHAFEIWSNPRAVAERFALAAGFALPSPGRSSGNEARRVIRYEPTVWLVEGAADRLHDVLGEDGVLTAIGGGIARIRIAGSAWRTLLMEGGMFDAESPAFTKHCSAATAIDQVGVRLHVVSEDACDVYVPASFSAGLIHFWEQAAETLAP